MEIKKNMVFAKELYYKYLGSLRFLIKLASNLIFSNRLSTSTYIELLRDFSFAKSDVLEYLKISEAEYWNYAIEWEAIERELFLNRENINAFYGSWRDEFAKANICANVTNQFLFAYYYEKSKPYYEKAKSILDYGCGTASMTLAQTSKLPSIERVTLVELQEDIIEYVRYRINKCSLTNTDIINVNGFSACDQYDLVICFDVLEHLENPSDVFSNIILPLVKIGGHLILRAPWRGQLTHIDEAPNDFYGNGGRKILDSYFVEVDRFGGGDINCVYRRCV